MSEDTPALPGSLAAPHGVTTCACGATPPAPLAVPVWSKVPPSAASMLGIGRSLAYAAAASGDIPTVRVHGRVLVPVEALRARLLAPAEERRSRPCPAS